MSGDIDRSRRRFLGRTAATVAAVRLGVLGSALQQAACMARAAVVDSELTALGGATEWINTAPLTADALRGKVVAVDFCTYTCINWLRTLPRVRAWAEKYAGKGLVVIGAHTPEFGFERDIANVRRAMTDMRVAYPVAIDNDQAIWNGFRNGYWPALYLVDATGRLRYHHFGEGAYEESERTIQKLLGEAGVAGLGRDLVSVDGRGIEADADWHSLESQETYVGYERTLGFASPGGMKRDERQSYALPARLPLNQWALSGDWTIERDRLTLHSPGGRLAYHFHARDLHLVMGPAARGASVRFRVSVDGHAPEAAHGGDVDERGDGTATAQRLYQLIRQPKPIPDRVFEIEFLGAGVEAYSFTFG